MANKKVPQGQTLKLKNVRLSFPSLDKASVPKGYENSEPKFSASFLLDKSDATQKEQIKLCNNEINRLIKEAWGERPARMEPIECFGKGEDFVSKKTNKPYDGYAGQYVVAANNKRRPLVLDRSKNVLSPEEVAEKLYGGCYVNAIINFWVQDNPYGQAIRCSLQGVQFFADGESFSSGGASVDDFDDLEDGELTGSDDFDDLDDDIDF